METISTDNTSSNIKDEQSLTSLTQWIFLFTIASFAFFIDQLSKWMVVQSLDYQETWVPIGFLEGIFDFTYTRNTGAAFGLGQNLSDVFLVIAVIVCLFIIYYYRQIPEGNLFIRLALGLEMGGALGNAIDRVRLGYVVDFLHVHGWPVFNLADSMIVLGVIILIGVMSWQDYQENKHQKQTSATSHKPTEES